MIRLLGACLLRLHDTSSRCLGSSSLGAHVFSPFSDMPLFLQDTRASRYWSFG
jgi:hypothetical protein